MEELSELKLSKKAISFYKPSSKLRTLSNFSLNGKRNDSRESNYYYPTSRNAFNLNNTSAIPMNLLKLHSASNYLLYSSTIGSFQESLIKKIDRETLEAVELTSKSKTSITKQFFNQKNLPKVNKTQSQSHIPNESSNENFKKFNVLIEYKENKKKVSIEEPNILNNNGNRSKLMSSDKIVYGFNIDNTFYKSLSDVDLNVNEDVFEINIKATNRMTSTPILNKGFPKSSKGINENTKIEKEKSFYKKDSLKEKQFLELI